MEPTAVTATSATFVYGNMVWNACLVIIAGWLFRRCVKGLDTTITNNAKATAQVALETKENFKEVRESFKEVQENIKELSDHVSVANGRTAKNEQAISDQKELCARIHGK